MVMNFELAGQQFMALNGGPIFKFTEAISLVVNCETQNEVDHFWEALTEVGSECQCGWLKDRYGLSWQIVPTILGKLTGDKDAARTTRVMQVMMKMVKLDIAALQAAYDGH
jgi:predicted 3-demethylubiquinone-9 3-methyltransferase (glyoxalase superfamily)